MTDSYYRRLDAEGDVQLFDSTKYTASNWDSTIQHGSPPLALMTRLLEDQAAGSGQRTGRLLLDILGAIPVAPVRVRSWVQRPGSRISLHQAEMSAQRPDGRWRAVATLSAWMLAAGDTAAVAYDRHPPLTEGEQTNEAHGWDGAPGYLESVSWRRQAVGDGGASVAWLRSLLPLVDDEPVTDLQRLALVVDSANGVGAQLDPASYTFMNTDTAVHLHRLPRGEDFGVRARGSIGPDGIGVTTAEIYDRDGFIGTSAQTLLVMPR